MDFLPLTAEDEDLIRAAEEVILRNYDFNKHHVGAALRCKSGRIYTGVHLESNGNDVCAEPVALGAAATAGEREFECIVAVEMFDRKNPRVISPCGGCRELIKFYGPEIAVLLLENGSVKKCRAGDLLPGPTHWPRKGKNHDAT